MGKLYDRTNHSKQTAALKHALDATGASGNHLRKVAFESGILAGSSPIFLSWYRLVTEKI